MSLVVFYSDMKAFDPVVGYTICKDKDAAMLWLGKKAQLMGGLTFNYYMTNSVSEIVSYGDRMAATFPEMYEVVKAVKHVIATQRWEDLVPDDAWQVFDSSALWPK